MDKQLVLWAALCMNSVSDRAPELLESSSARVFSVVGFSPNLRVTGWICRDHACPMVVPLDASRDCVSTAAQRATRAQTVHAVLLSVESLPRS